MTDAEKLRSLADSQERLSGGAPEIIAWVNDLRRIADLLDSVPPEVLKALAAGMKTAVSTALLRQIATQRLSGEMQEDTQHDADFMEGYDCVVRVARAMLAAAPEKPE